MFGPAPSADEADAALLTAQYREMCEQMPTMYGGLLLNMLLLSFVAYGTVPTVLGVGMPAILGAAGMARVLAWWRKRALPPPAACRIRRQLRATVVLAGVLSSAFCGWGLLLFEYVGRTEQACIGLFIFISAMICSHHLQMLPGGVRTVLVCGGLPMAVRLLASGDGVLVGVGSNLLLASALSLHMLAAKYASVVELLQSRAALVTERARAREAEARAHALAHRDPLTGLPNRRALGERLRASTAAGRPGLGLLIVDLDRFKPVNDLHGHPAGDRLLRAVADRLGGLLAPGDIAFRLGGDEFAVLAAAGEDGEAPHRLARRIVAATAEPYAIAGLVHHIGASVGVASFPADAADGETLLRRADVALYRAKEMGRCRHQAFDPAMDDEIRRRAELEGELLRALAADEFRPFYQPVIDLQTGAPVGFEMLARWPRPDGREIGPDVFIPIAEENGSIDELMLKLLDRACLDARDWEPHLTVAVNISPVQLKDPRLGEKVLAVLSRRGFAARRLAIEVTESALIADAENARRTVESFKAHGMRIKLDDFGVGYSSLRHLQVLPFDELKLDRSFVRSIDRDPEALKIVRAIAGLARCLDLPVIAEGVESPAVAARLREAGCAQAQGFYYGRPMPAAAVAQALRSGELRRSARHARVPPAGPRATGRDLALSE